MKKLGNKKIMVIVISIVLCAVLVIGGLMLFGKIQMGKVPGLSFEDALKYTTHGKKDAKITVGIIKDGKSSFTVYGADAQVLPSENHIYEIGSLSKTMTAALISKAVSEGKLSLNSTIDAYLPLSEGNNYPTITELVTHTSGYNAWYFETPMIGNFFAGRNSFCGISRDMVLEKAKELDMNRDSYGFTYSNFGYAVLGLVLEAAYDKDYTTLLNEYVQKELGMAWIIDRKNGIIWHNGGTGNYNSYLGFCPDSGTAVVVLSNLSPNDRIPATVLGIKKLLEVK